MSSLVLKTLLFLGLAPLAALQAAACSYAVTPLTISMSSVGGSTLVVVQAGAGCGWYGQVAESWLTMKPATSKAGAGGVIDGEGTEEILVQVTPSTTPRIGYIVLAAHTITINQTGITAPPAPPVAGSGPNNCGATEGTGYAVSSSVVYQAGQFLEFPFTVANESGRNLPSLYVVLPNPVSSEWKVLGNPAVTYCYSSSGNYLIPILSIPSGTVNVNNQVEIYSTNPDIAPPRLNFDGANVISGLPDR